jgi:hypothetical protein
MRRKTMAKEYIEREAFREFWNKEFRHLYPNDKYLVALANFPTADVVEVVRCKDCKYYEIHKPSVTLNCERGGRMIPMNPDDFCSYGAKMDGKVLPHKFLGKSQDGECGVEILGGKGDE